MSKRRGDSRRPKRGEGPRSRSPVEPELPYATRVGGQTVGQLHHVKRGDTVVVETPDGGEVPVLGLVVEMGEGVPVILTGVPDPISLLLAAAMNARATEMEMRAQIQAEMERRASGGQKGFHTVDGFHAVDDSKVN